MAMPPRLRKISLTIHVACSVGWIGTVVAYLILGISAATTNEPATIRASWLAMELVGWRAVLPLAVGSLATGFLMALGTRWGLFRHYWVLISLLLTTFALVVLILHLPAVSAMAATAQVAERADLESLGGDLAHPAIGFVVLVAVQVLNTYKPKGLTRYGWRLEQRRRVPEDTYG